MPENPRGQRLYAATPHLMYARKVSLAIDGKAMYFGGEFLPSDLGLRPSDVGLRSGIPGRSLQSSSSWDLDSAVEERRFRAALPERGCRVSAPVAPLGLKATQVALRTRPSKGRSSTTIAAAEELLGGSKPAATD